MHSSKAMLGEQAWTRLQQIRTAGGPASTPLVLTQLLSKVVPMVVRGSWARTRFENAGAIPLIGRHVTFRNPQFISVGAGFVAEDYCEIQGLSQQGVSFADNVTVGRFAMIRPSGYYRPDVGVGLRVGNDSNIGAYCYVGCSGGIEIGDNVLMSPRVSLFAENHRFDDPAIAIKKQGVKLASITVQDDCWLASGSTILAGVTVGTGSIVAAGAVVNNDVPPFAIVGGVPARVLSWRKQPDEEQADT